jgi:hypothetical protein
MGEREMGDGEREPGEGQRVRRNVPSVRYKTLRKPMVWGRQGVKSRDMEGTKRIWSQRRGVADGERKAPAERNEDKQPGGVSLRQREAHSSRLLSFQYSRGAMGQPLGCKRTKQGEAF